ncbi:MAG: PP2C family protein-serine/threonine phosphatase [Mariprofundaceae bacterium]|nr:PP2C family protein-serine/threonine phosphatase [Mariprofundaceae bacterium]
MLQFWPLFAIFIMAQWLMRSSGNVASIAIPWWLSIIDSTVFATVFIAASIWVHRPIRRALPYFKASSTRSKDYLEHAITLLPRRALNGFLMAGFICAFYLMTVLSIGHIISHSHMTPRMFLALGLNLIYGVGFLAPAVALAMTLAYAARIRQLLSEKGLFLQSLNQRSQPVSWSKISKRPWIIFLITSAMPVSILACFVYLILGTNTMVERHFILLQAGILCLSLLLAGTWLTFVIGQIVQRIMNTLSSALQRLHDHQFDKPTPILLDDEFGLLSEGINMAFIGLKEQAVLKENLEVATDIHQAMLPQTSPLIPHYQLHGFQQSCQDVGGDYYDHILLANGHVWLIVADVAGKGYAAALSVANLRASFHALAYLNLSLEKAADYINHSLCGTLTGGRFITLFMADLNTETHDLTWINAGHMPVLCCLNGRVNKLSAIAPPMGLQDALPFPSQHYHIQENELLLAYSDGVTEARQHQTHDLYGENRLSEWLIQHEHDKPWTTHLQQELNSFGELAADDDVTILFLQREQEA